MSSLARYERVGVVMGYGMQAVRIGVVRPSLQSAAHQDHVLESLGSDKPQFAATAWKQRIEHSGAGIQHDIEGAEEVVQGYAPCLGGVCRWSNEAVGFVARRRRGLADLEVAPLVHQNGVGHCSAGVDAYDDGIAHRLRSANGYLWTEGYPPLGV